MRWKLTLFDAGVDVHKAYVMWSSKMSQNLQSKAKANDFSVTAFENLQVPISVIPVDQFQ